MLGFLDDDDVQRILLETHLEFFQFKVMPFGFCKTLAKPCERLTDCVLWWSPYLVYLNDIASFGDYFSRGGANLEKGYDWVHQYGEID